jgi:hypothetical protein
MDVRELLATRVDTRMHAGNELELGLAEIGRDTRVSQRRSERGGMRSHRERAVAAHAQALFLDAASPCVQDPGGQRMQALEYLVQNNSPRALILPQPSGTARFAAGRATLSAAWRAGKWRATRNPFDLHQSRRDVPLHNQIVISPEKGCS